MGAANTAAGMGRHVAAVRLGKVYGPAIGEPGEAGEKRYCCEGARPACHRRARGAIWQPGRSLTWGVALIVIVLLSLGIWGIIWLAVALLASVWQQ